MAIGYILGCIATLPGWRNGRRARLRGVWEQSLGGSSPLSGTSSSVSVAYQNCHLGTANIL